MIAVSEFPGAQAEVLVGAVARQSGELAIEVLRTVLGTEGAVEVAIALANEVAAPHARVAGDAPLLGLVLRSEVWPMNVDDHVGPLANTVVSYTHAGDRDGVVAAMRSPSEATIKRMLVLLARCVNQMRRL